MVRLRGKRSTETTFNCTKQQEYADTDVPMLKGFLFGLCSCETDLLSGILTSFKGQSSLFVSVIVEKRLTGEINREANIKSINNHILLKLSLTMRKHKRTNIGL